MNCLSHAQTSLIKNDHKQIIITFVNNSKPQICCFFHTLHEDINITTIVQWVLALIIYIIGSITIHWTTQYILIALNPMDSDSSTNNINHTTTETSLHDCLWETISIKTLKLKFLS